MIKFSNVSLIYPNSTTTVIEDLNLEIAEGELVLVIGPTGSGKSSLLRLINGLVPHHTGGILACLLYTSPSPRDRTRSRMPSSA